MFWRNVEFANKKIIVFKVLGTDVTFSRNSIAKEIGCLIEGNTYQDGWEKNYDYDISRVHYKENVEKAGDQKTIVYNLMYERAKMWANILSKSVLHK